MKERRDGDIRNIPARRMNELAVVLELGTVTGRKRVQKNSRRNRFFFHPKLFAPLVSRGNCATGKFPFPSPFQLSNSPLSPKKLERK